ncbi:hypothetical protein AEQ48_09660 [Pseudomonas libanensis]|uniref:Uncharacterized protein n=1 Tax=Pseudomonas libanensis TaxID=75588 RepID=A0ABR5M9E0_9PSED|nr:hypothetical protein AEQ48_09660 [Pseudomonas libanensis]
MGTLRRLAAFFQVRRVGQQNSVATDSRQIIWATIWQRISPIVVALLLICPAYIARALIVGITP